MAAHEMTPEEIRAFLMQGTRTAKIATVMHDGTPHVMPVWFTLDGDDLLFCTGEGTVKARDLARDPRVSLCVEDDTPPYGFVHVRGHATLTDEPDEVRRVATIVGGRYMGADRAAEFGARNAVPGELLVRVTPERTIAVADLAD